LNRSLTSVGLLVALAGTFLFYGVFVGLTPGFVAFLAALILLPIGSGVLFYGAAYRGTFSAQPAAAGGGGGATTGTVWAAIAVAVIAILLAVASLSVALNAQSNAGTANDQINSINSNINSVNSAVAGLGTKPATVAVKIDWCNTDPTGQDRYCPNEFVVNQGDTVQVMFIHNDTDAHTFTLDNVYFFQINGSDTGMRNFLTNESNAGPCSNSGTFAQESAAISGIYCVSGSSLLPVTSPPTNFKIAQNPTPANPFLPGGQGVVDVPVDNMVHINFDNESSGVVEVWGIGSFQATTPGIYEFFCHYHVSNGMFGYVVVLPNAYCTSNPSSCGITG
jgi:plastocyanin